MEGMNLLDMEREIRLFCDKMESWSVSYTGPMDPFHLGKMWCSPVLPVRIVIALNHIWQMVSLLTEWTWGIRYMSCCWYLTSVLVIGLWRHHVPQDLMVRTLVVVIMWQHNSELKYEIFIQGRSESVTRNRIQITNRIQGRNYHWLACSTNKQIHEVLQLDAENHNKENSSSICSYSWLNSLLCHSRHFTCCGVLVSLLFFFFLQTKV